MGGRNRNTFLNQLEQTREFIGSIGKSKEWAFLDWGVQTMLSRRRLSGSLSEIFFFCVGFLLRVFFPHFGKNGFQLLQASITLTA